MGRSAAVCWCATALLAASAGLQGAVGSGDEHELGPPQPVDDGVPASVEGWREIGCARCHEAITEEWAGTRHALAWVDPHYQKALRGLRRPKSCHGCHVPLPLHVDRLRQKPRPRALNLAHGVDSERLFAMPYAVDNEFFRRRSAAAAVAPAPMAAAVAVARAQPDRRQKRD